MSSPLPSPSLFFLTRRKKGETLLGRTVQKKIKRTKIDPSVASQNPYPVMYWTGTKDTTCPSWESADAYNLTKATPSTYSDLEGATHTEIFTGHPNRPDPYAVQYFQCLLKKNSTSCNIISGKDKEYALCDNDEYKYDGCHVKE